MSLRLKLGLTIVVAAIPLLWGVSWLRNQIDESAFKNAVRTYVGTVMDVGAAEYLASNPETWGGGIGRSSRRDPRSGRRRGRERERSPENKQQREQQRESRGNVGSRQFAQ